VGKGAQRETVRGGDCCGAKRGGSGNRLIIAVWGWCRGGLLLIARRRGSGWPRRRRGGDPGWARDAADSWSLFVLVLAGASTSFSWLLKSADEA